MSVRATLTGLAIALAVTSAAEAQETHAIVGGTVHTLAGRTVEGGTVLIEDGRISRVGTNVPIPAGANRIDASGLHVYPGLFNAFSQLGLQEINSVSETNDVMELGEFNPHLAAATAVHPASERIPVTRAAGVTHVVAVPSARSGGIGGRASAVHLDGWTIEEMLIRESVGMVLRWPTLSARNCTPFGCFGPSRPFSQVRESYEEAVEEMRTWFEDARRYRRSSDADASGRRDLRLEAMIEVLEGELPLLVIADQARDIRNAVEFVVVEQGARMILVSGRDAWQVSELLLEHDVPVLYRATQNVPSFDDDPYHLAFSAPARMAEAGMRFALTGWGSSGPNPPSRTIAQEAANAVKFGLPEEEALKAITSYPAQILGMGDQLGTIESGKVANLVVTDGNPLQIRTKIRHVFVNGRPASLMNKHLELYERYRARR